MNCVVFIIGIFYGTDMFKLFCKGRVLLCVTLHIVDLDLISTCYIMLRFTFCSVPCFINVYVNSIVWNSIVNPGINQSLYTNITFLYEYTTIG